MARVEFFGDTRVYGYANLQDYEISAFSGDRITMVFDEDRRAFDPDAYPWRVQFFTENARTHRNESGEDRGQTVFTAGEVTRVVYYTKGWEPLLEITDVDASLAYLSARYAHDRLFGFYDYLIDDGAEFVNPGDVRTSIGPDIVRAGPNAAFIKDLGGADTYAGGGGRDTLTYDEWFWEPAGAVVGLYANLVTGRVRGPDRLIDRVSSIEELRGSFLDDVMKGSDSDERFAGMQGDDTIKGRGGFDIVHFFRDGNQGGTDGAVVKLGNGFARDGFGGIDRLFSIEGAIGTNQSDVLRGSKKDNYFDGLGGDDQFRLYNGDDTVRGGPGDDLFEFAGRKFGLDVIEDFSGGDMIKIIRAKRFSDLEIDQRGDDVLVRFTDKAAILLENSDAADITASDFLF